MGPSRSMRTSGDYYLAALLSHAVWFEVLVVLVLVWSQAAAHARYLDVAWAAMFSIFVAGPVVVALGLPASLAVAVLVRRRRYAGGVARSLAEAVGIGLVVWMVWGTIAVLSLMAARIAFSSWSVRGAVSSAVILALVSVPLPVLDIWFLHTEKDGDEPAPSW